MNILKRRVKEKNSPVSIKKINLIQFFHNFSTSAKKIQMSNTNIDPARLHITRGTLSMKFTFILTHYLYNKINWCIFHISSYAPGLLQSRNLYSPDTYNIKILFI